MPRFEIRCHEDGDDSDYLWSYRNTLEEALKVVKNSNLYETLYIIEISDDGNRSIPEYDRDNFEPL
jgi:hypothetical protein